MRRAITVLALGVALTSASSARADSQEESAAVSAYSLDRPHTLVDVGLGALTLPAAKLCTSLSCTTTDLTLLIALRHLYKWNRHWGVGAGISWGLRPGTDDATVHGPDGVSVARTHARNYFSVAGNARYYPVAEDQWHLWVGLTSGIIVVSDRYALSEKGTSIVGPKNVTVASEGFMAGLGFGFDWSLARNWTVGAWTTQMIWHFPATRSCAQTVGDCATVSGSLFSFETGLSVTYRVRM